MSLNDLTRQQRFLAERASARLSRQAATHDGAEVREQVRERDREEDEWYGLEQSREEDHDLDLKRIDRMAEHSGLPSARLL